MTVSHSLLIAASQPTGDDLVFGLTATEVGAVAGVVALILTLVQIFMTAATERRRAQPIAITHETRPRSYDVGRQRWRALVRVANESEATAFNVRFGVSYFGVRFAYRLHEKDRLSGNRHRVMREGDAFSAAIEATSQDLWGGRATPEDDVYYWARYENASGATWETTNPPDRTANLMIRRVRFVRSREWLETRRRKKLTKEGEAVMREIHSEFAQNREAAMAAKAAGHDAPPAGD